MEKTEKYNVHHYLLVRVKCEGVTAPTMKKAIEQTEESVMEWAQQNLCGNIGQREFEYAEETIAWLVDVDGDDDYEQSQAFENVQGHITPVIAPTPTTK